jgi:mono/diheme cytochrome c family protein
MKSFFAFFAILAVTQISAVRSANAHDVIATAPVYVPDLSHENDHLGLRTMAWDATMKTTNVPADAGQAHFVFSFTNVTKSPVIIVDAHGSCSCTTAQLPPLPWGIPPGSNGEIGVTVDIAGKFGTLVKTVHIGTDKGSRDLIVQVTILPPKIPVLTDADRVRQMAIAKVDRQAVFKNDCAACHEKNGESRYGKQLYDADCGICHEAEHRAWVPDLHALKVPTNEDFWRVWISHGKPGTFMPAFSDADGGPLSDMQIASLVAYLNAAIPSNASGKMEDGR